ncbi:MAG: choice-of-anchor D domain-containing protein, partial [Pseudomonadota bacterium]|nr:choice-of-anchor D domain-containing protein [Pseudomonadota bacterium]
DNQLNFGTELMGNSISRSYWVNSWTLGCGTLQPDFPELTGNHADEFTISKQDCYQGSYRQPQGMYSYASCQTTITFTPTTAGEKQAQLALMFNDDTVTTDPVSIQAQAVEPPGEVKIKLTPEALDFGNLILGRDATVPKAVTIENQGEVNLNLNQMRLTGEAASAFSLNSWYWHDSCAQKGFLFPQESCQTNVQFSPLAEGEQRAQLVVLPDSAAVALIGRVRTPVDCGSENITLKTSGQSFNWHEATSWSPERLPTAEDVVLIQPDHAITGIPFAQVKSLCIATGGSLVSADHQGTPLEIQATDYIENRGIIRGLAGANEESGAECTQAVGTTLCAQGGASVILKVGTHITRYGKGEDWWWQSYTSGGPILNLGQIIAGDGGHGQHYGASGGHAIVLGRNTVNKGQILAGHGGDILGLDNGAAGHGGITQIWGKLGGSGHLYNQDGAQAFAGDGGNCNPNASGNQRGGEGGNLWLVSIPNVHLGGGQHRSGKGGNKCAINGEEGDVIIEPSLISLAGANTRIEGNQVTIFGGLDWQLDLTDLQTTVVEAKGDITLAVGEGGIIDFRGSRGTLFKAAGQVNLFADEIALDSDTVLSELIEAEQIVVGPAQILWDIALTGPGTVLGAPGDTVPLYLTLANNSPELVGVQFQATDAAGWPLAELSEKIQVPALTSVNLALNVTLPTTLESTDQVTVTASLDQAPSVTSTTTVQIIVSENAPRHENNRPIIPAEEQNQPNDTPVEPNEGQDNTDAPPISEETPPPTTPIGMAAQINAHLDNCPLSGTIDFLCTNYGRRISDAVLTAQASIAGGELSGVIENAGMIAQVILQPDTVLSGGKGSGYIINHGTLKDFEFVGAEVQGGTLAGMIFNNSRVGGVLKDVHLAAATQVRGGQLQGEIIGDAEAPALLTQLTVKSGSQLNHVMIGDQVTLADEVTLGDNVQFLNPSDSPLTDTPDDELPAEPSTPEPSLPALGAVNAQNAQGQTLTVEAEFSGGIQVSGNEAQQTAEVELTDNVEIIGMMDSEHAGQTVDLIVYAAYTPLATPEAQPLYYMLTEQEQILPWDQKPANLVAFKPAVTLQAKQLETFYDGHFLAPGHLDIYYGYRTEEGHIITHLEAIKVTIVE